MRRISRRLAVLAVMVVVAGIGTGVLTAGALSSGDSEAVVKDPNPDTWVDPATGLIDYSKVPARIRMHTSLGAGGVGWLDSWVLYGPQQAKGPVPIYRAETGDETIGWYNVDTDEHISPSGVIVRRSTPATTVVGGGGG